MMIQLDVCGPIVPYTLMEFSDDFQKFDSKVCLFCYLGNDVSDMLAHDMPNRDERPPIRLRRIERPLIRWRRIPDGAVLGGHRAFVEDLENQ
ncbi:unnamed protein product [Larinioides sclopetarius]|uniref:Uncharacterized protein n=1 Tax=Larinioides sclopetarius TaxID=280406 RepID=A0AAV2ATK4_9ARAC